jgi:hypothetical protein
MIELEERLFGPEGSAERHSQLKQLDSIELRLRQQMSAGLSREEFTVWQQTLSAVRAARESLKALPPGEPTDAKGNLTNQLVSFLLHKE